MSFPRAVRFSSLVSSAGSANVPIVGIKRVGREGNTVSVTAAGRGTIGFEPQVSEATVPGNRSEMETWHPKSCCLFS